MRLTTATFDIMKSDPKLGHTEALRSSEKGQLGKYRCDAVKSKWGQQHALNASFSNQQTLSQADRLAERCQKLRSSIARFVSPAAPRELDGDLAFGTAHDTTSPTKY